MTGKVRVSMFYFYALELISIFFFAKSLYHLLLLISTKRNWETFTFKFSLTTIIASVVIKGYLKSVLVWKLVLERWSFLSRLFVWTKQTHTKCPFTLWLNLNSMILLLAILKISSSQISFVFWSAIIFPFYFSGILIGKIIFSLCIAKFFIVFAFDGFYVYSAELFPTVIRWAIMPLSVNICSSANSWL